MRRSKFESSLDQCSTDELAPEFDELAPEFDELAPESSADKLDASQFQATADADEPISDSEQSSATSDQSYMDTESEDDQHSSNQVRTRPSSISAKSQTVRQDPWISFQKRFNNMDDSQKWMLKTGTKVEDQIYAYIDEAENRDHLLTTPIACFQVNWQREEALLDLFNKKEKDEILTQVNPTIPRLSGTLSGIFDHIDIDKDGTLTGPSQTQVRELAKTASAEWLYPWLQTVLWKWIKVCELPFMRVLLSEEWWTTNLWTSVFDNLFQTVSNMRYVQCIDSLWILIHSHWTQRR